MAQPGDPRLDEVAHVYAIQGVDVSDFASLSWFRGDVVSTVDDLGREAGIARTEKAVQQVTVSSVEFDAVKPDLAEHLADFAKGESWLLDHPPFQ